MVPPPDEANQRLLRLLALKRHELPPPGFFDRLPDRVLVSIRSSTVISEESVPWWTRFWKSLVHEPMVTGSYAVLGIGALFFGVSVFQMALDQESPAFATTGGVGVGIGGVGVVPGTPGVPSSPVESLPIDALFRVTPASLHLGPGLPTSPMGAPAGNPRVSPIFREDIASPAWAY